MRMMGWGHTQVGDVDVRRATVRLLAALLALLAACTGAEVGGDAASPPPAVAPSAPARASAAPSSPQQQALEAYQRFTAATVDALSSGAVDGAGLSEVARGQALAHARRRLVANGRDQVVTTGTLTPSATVGQVKFDGARTATISDCVLNDLTQVADDDPDRVVTAATGWRQPVTATVVKRDGGWTVTKVKVPLRDGSGRVPPPPDDPPFLRGPAQGPAPPSCVPDDLARDAVAGYLSFQNAYDKALGFGRRGTADPDLPDLLDTTVDPQLSATRAYLQDLADNDEVVRGEPSSRDPWAISTLESDKKIIVYDCVTVGANRVTDIDETEPGQTNADAGSKRLDGADVVRVGNRWKVASVAVVAEGLEECLSSVQ